MRGGCLGACPGTGLQLVTAQLQTGLELEVKRSRMLRGLGLLLPALVLGALLHHEVAMSGDCMSSHVSQVLSGDENSPVQLLFVPPLRRRVSVQLLLDVCFSASGPDFRTSDDC